MRSEARKYCDYARECVRLAGRAETSDLRDQLLDLARVWMDAAMTEDGLAGEKPSTPLPPSSAGGTEADPASATVR
jgi:hypothetical protein